MEEKIKRLMEVRRRIKKKKPTFLRQESHKVKKLNNRPKWRSPKGMHSKIRRKLQGRRIQPSLGYSSPRQVRGLTREGFKPVLIHTLNQLKDNKVILLSKTLGLRKKLQLLKKAEELKIKVLNVKDIPNFIKSAEEKIKLKKESSKKLEEKKKKAKIQAEEKAEKKKEEKKEETPEEKEKREKEEKRKVLEQRT